jgi:hypothetical protein
VVGGLVMGALEKLYRQPSLFVCSMLRYLSSQLHAPLRDLEVETPRALCHAMEQMQAASPKAGVALSCTTSARLRPSSLKHTYRLLNRVHPGGLLPLQHSF